MEKSNKLRTNVPNYIFIRKTSYIEILIRILACLLFMQYCHNSDFNTDMSIVHITNHITYAF
jgi:hypothetical protein